MPTGHPYVLFGEMSLGLLPIFSVGLFGFVVVVVAISWAAPAAYGGSPEN